MTGLCDLLGEKSFLALFEEHSNCHVVIDGSNLQYFFALRSHALSNFPGYEQTVRDFFKHLLDAGITPHVFFDGPSKCDPNKWERGIIRRQERLQKLIHGTVNFRVLDHPQPTAVQDVFRYVIHSLGIRSIQVSAKRDYTLEMVSHAKFLDAFLISGNAKFFVEDIRRGFVCLQRNEFANYGFKLNRPTRTFHFKKLSGFINLEGSQNPHALTMWAVVLFNRKTFEQFSKGFFGGASRRLACYPQTENFCVAILGGNRRQSSSLKMLQFFLERTRADAEKIVCEQLYPGKRKDAMLLFEESISAQLVEPHDVFERLDGEIETGKFCDEDLPPWFLRYSTLECKLFPSLMDVLTDRRHQLVSLLEDFDEKSVNESTLRLRRIIYGILFPESGEHDGIIITISELDRVRDELEEIDQTPMRSLWNPENPSESLDVPGLNKMELLREPERLQLFLLSMGVEETFRREVDSNEAMYVAVILRYWIAANENIGKRDLLRVLLTALLVERRYSKPSHIFRKPVHLNEDSIAKLGISFCPSSVLCTGESFACMHPLALLQNTTLFGKTLHRLFMQPLGADSDAIETITSEVAFYHVFKLTQRLDEDELSDFIVNQMEEESRGNFKDTVDLIWDEEAVARGRNLVRASRDSGDDERL